MSSRGIRYSNIGRAPGEEHGRAAHAGERPSELEPVVLRHVLLGDGQEAREPGLRGQEVVAGAVGAPRALGIREAVADREQLVLPVIEEPEVHLRDQGFGAGGESQEALPQGRDGRGGRIRGERFGASRQAPQPLGQGQQGPGEVAAVDRGHVARQERLEGAGVVPVEQVALVALEPIQGGEGLLETLGQLRDRRGSRDRGRPGWREAPWRCWWARCGGPPSGPGSS